jgi:osmotically-inducible protein OsmY
MSAKSHMLKNRKQETGMNNRHTIPIIVTASMLAALSAAPAVFAGEQAKASMEQHSEEGQSAVKDAWLHGKLESALLFNEHLNSFDIDTDVKNGTAYLRGAVESDIDSDLAGEIAKSITGITNVENELVVDKAKAAMAKDTDAAKERHGFKQSVLNATLTARIKSTLLMNNNTGGMAINVDSKQGVVTLSGEVKSDQEKDLAIRLASNTSGATSVNDQLVVKSD